jgi:hypothetical protein
MKGEDGKTFILSRDRIIEIPYSENSMIFNKYSALPDIQSGIYTASDQSRFIIFSSSDRLGLEEIFILD